ncbi:MAG: hypothetical protein ACKO34_09005 [Vampirovibrionales bacterium]
MAFSISATSIPISQSISQSREGTEGSVVESSPTSTSSHTSETDTLQLTSAVAKLEKEAEQVNQTIGQEVGTLKKEVAQEKTRLEKTKDFVGKHYGWLLTGTGGLLVVSTWLLNAARLHSAKPPKIEAIASTLTPAVVNGTSVAALPKTTGDKLFPWLFGVGAALGTEQLAHSVGTYTHVGLLEKTPGVLGKLWDVVTQHGS